MTVLLDKLLVYSCLIAALFSCSPSGDDVPPPLPPLPPDPIDSIVHKGWLLGLAEGTEMGSFNLTYDEAGILREITSVRGNYKVFYANDLISHILAPIVRDASSYQRQSIIFTYDDKRRCKKVYYIYGNSYEPSILEETNPYFTTYNPRDASDSVAYTQSGAVAGVYQMRNHQSGRKVLFTYATPESVSPVELYEERDLNLDGIFEPVMKVDLVMSAVDQPANKFLWFCPFLEFVDLSVAPTEPAMTGAKYLPLLKKGIESWKSLDYSSGYRFQSKKFIYYYSSDSLYFNGRCNPDDITFPDIKYSFLKH